MENKKKIIKIFLISSLIIFISLNSASVINNETYDGIKQAIDDINSSGTINLEEGIYTGENNTNILINDKNVTIFGKNNKTIIDGNNQIIFEIAPSGKLTLINITIQNSQSINGGAINNQGELNILSSKFIKNTGNYGGDI